MPLEGCLARPSQGLFSWDCAGVIVCVRVCVCTCVCVCMCVRVCVR